jgi:cyclopropane fatty-acyl-phospholipid synthase-like methyltransferase
MYSKYYDRLNNGYDFWVPFISDQISEIPHGSRIIEYGCGTGNVLLHYKDNYQIAGVDLSPEMLDQAKKKIPSGEFFLEDMVTFKPDKKYDVALCLFDSVNHILSFCNWRAFFQNVAGTLNTNGVFILDANTTERLNGIEKRPAFFQEFDDNYFYMKLRKKDQKNFIFDVRVLKKIGCRTYEEEREEIEETTESGSKIFDALKDVFSLVSVYDEKKQRLNVDQFKENEKCRWFFSCVK